MQTTDYYALIGATIESTPGDITKAYRKAALQTHPDKNPDDAGAAAKFHALAEAYAVLGDEKARAAYDAVVRARQQKKRRVEALDGARQKMKEDLERREKAALQEKRTREEAEAKFQAELRRLRMEKEKEKERQAATSTATTTTTTTTTTTSTANHSLDRTIKIKWKGKARDEDQLRELFLPYGSIEAIVLGRKGKSALVSYSSIAGAVGAIHGTGKGMDGLAIEWAGAAPAPGMVPGMLPEIAPEKIPGLTGGAHHAEYETLTLLRMRQKERARLEAELLAEEEVEVRSGSKR